MRIVIIASGIRGDVEPYVALGEGLQASGHVVRLVTGRGFWTNSVSFYLRGDLQGNNDC
jgi:UDP:flavonoid glycosyltransferase YjiC (YdhE family)